jgi:hypothetical protein
VVWAAGVACCWNGSGNGTGTAEQAAATEETRPSAATQARILGRFKTLFPLEG